MLGLPFFAILGVVFQAGLHILTQQSLDDAVSNRFEDQPPFRVQG
jgi:hypothetical protein